MNHKCPSCGAETNSSGLCRDCYREQHPAGFYGGGFEGDDVERKPKRTLPCCHCGSAIEIPAKYARAKSAAHDDCITRATSDPDPLFAPDPVADAAEFPQYVALWGTKTGVLTLARETFKCVDCGCETPRRCAEDICWDCFVKRSGVDVGAAWAEFEEEEKVRRRRRQVAADSARFWQKLKVKEAKGQRAANAVLAGAAAVGAAIGAATSANAVHGFFAGLILGPCLLVGLFSVPMGVYLMVSGTYVLIKRVLRFAFRFIDSFLDPK